MLYSHRTTANQEEFSTNNRKNNEDYVLEEFKKVTEVLSLPLPNPDGTFHGKYHPFNDRENGYNSIISNVCLI